MGRKSPYRRSSGGTRSRSTRPRAASAHTRRWQPSTSPPSSCGRGSAKSESQTLPERREAGGSPADEPARLQAENARLLKAEKEWQLEREILHRAAAYFAREVK